ncbi:hypothetical protein SAMN05444273_104285 [Litoreibacter ascidiaceicola]|uniref:Uncharacterized protein n=1 Tax=Litoreibacter ascidiaceicola TaxID=1486859 RepID=A0A1M4ZQU7_9RHOB|nr:hypothetical protein [Litoreibacter ascidiaceicola]SHF20391.1 hypothetical protein SAMN05444273_104285 [Litoreibacter ascidiaceicola]
MLTLRPMTLATESGAANKYSIFSQILKFYCNFKIIWDSFEVSPTAQLAFAAKLR